MDDTDDMDDLIEMDWWKIKANQIDNDRLICKEKFINFNKKINNKKIINKNNIILDWKNLLDILLNSKYKYIEIL